MDQRAQAETLLKWWDHPDQFVRDVFNVEPDPWQLDILQAFPHQSRQAMLASKGPGKTALEAWLSWNFLVTRPHPKMAATSISAENLADNLWAEMAKWQHKSPLLQQFFEWTKTRIFSKEYPETWFMSARTWPKSADPDKQSDTLAGLHADYIMFVLDESGGIPLTVLTTADAALSSCIEGHILQGGNPTQLSGALYHAHMHRNMWHVTEVNGDPDNPKRSPRVSIEWARAQIETHGRDNPWVMVNVFGKFPPQSLNALIGPEEVKEAMGRYWRAHEIGMAPKILGVDVARQGDDQSVICKRQGIQVFPFEAKRGFNSTDGASWVNRTWNEWDADACFIDMTGGFGAGWFDQLINMGKTPFGVTYSARAHNESRYVNKRCEMYFDAVEWIKRGGALPECPELLAALTQTTYTHVKDKLLLEPKDDIKIKLGYSPDHADAFVQTFAETIAPRQAAIARRRPAKPYDPLAILSEPVREYDPYR